MNEEIEVRHCRGLREYSACVALERATWGEDITVPSAIFVVAHHTGGQILGAFDGSQLVGFTLALAGVRKGFLFLHSHMTAVAAAYQNRGVGRRLKLFQRQDALKRGFHLVEWTFDPLELKNAHFNLNRLGAVARRYISDCYGITGSPLHAGLPTDRLVAEWWLDSQRVQRILAEDPLPAASEFVRVSLPTNITESKFRERSAAAQIQSTVRGDFDKWFGQDYVVTGLETRGARTQYLLEPRASVGGLALPAAPVD